MKWTWISVSVALIISIAVICGFMICNHDYACKDFVWGLFILLAVYLGISGRALLKQVDNTKEQRCLTDRYQDEMQMRIRIESECMTEIKTLEKKIKDLNDEINKFKKGLSL